MTHGIRKVCTTCFYHSLASILGRFLSVFIVGENLTLERRPLSRSDHIKMLLKISKNSKEIIFIMRSYFNKIASCNFIKKEPQDVSLKYFCSISSM